ncbi:MAG: cupin domain-containing protein [Anaerolineales bacterium]
MAFVALDSIDTVEPFPGYLARFLHSEKMSVAIWQIGAGSPFPEHSHPHEQIMILTDGEFELTVDGATEVMLPGVVALIPPDAKHSGRALTDCKVIDVFHPVREDYR